MFRDTQQQKTPVLEDWPYIQRYFPRPSIQGSLIGGPEDTLDLHTHGPPPPSHAYRTGFEGRGNSLKSSDNPPKIGVNPLSIHCRHLFDPAEIEHFCWAMTHFWQKCLFQRHVEKNVLQRIFTHQKILSNTFSYWEQTFFRDFVKNVSLLSKDVISLPDPN